MISMFFSLRFSSQLGRTRPGLLRHLESSITDTVKSFGGTVRKERRLLCASFDDSSLGFALDLLCVIERLDALLYNVSNELYGYLCVFGKAVTEDDVPVMIKGFPSERWSEGIWCDGVMQEHLRAFVTFEKALSGPAYPLPLEAYARMQAIREFPAPQEQGDGGGNSAGAGDTSEAIYKYLKKGQWRNTIIAGAEHIGKRKGLHRYCREKLGDFPPLVVHFGGGSAVTCIADAFTPGLQALFAADVLEKLNLLAERLFRERLRDEVSGFLVQRCTDFLAELFAAYRAAAGKAKAVPVVILENMQRAGPDAYGLVTNAYAAFSGRDKLYLYGTCTDMQALKPWEDVFPRIIKFSPEGSGGGGLPAGDAPQEDCSSPALWEMAYACILFSRYFPVHLLSRLLAEEGKNPAMIEKTFSLFSSFRFIQNITGASQEHPALLSRARDILGQRSDQIRAVVRTRLLDWVKAGRLAPCYNLLEALAGLGGAASEALMLEAICGDVGNGTFGSIDRAIAEGSFAAVTGEPRSASLLFIYNAYKALNYGSPDEVRAVFRESPPESALPEEVPPDIRARIIACRALYHLSICDSETAAALTKEALLIVQQETGGRLLAHIYRLFSLVNLSNQRLSDAIDYFSFAVDEAEKTGAAGENAVIKYYSASANFIHGNLSMAERLARQAEEAALQSGQPAWADKCRFLQGRLRFELGCYEEALEIFEALQQSHYVAAPSGFHSTLAAWIYRAHNYLKRPCDPPLEGLDVQLFEVEGAFLAGDYRTVLELTRHEQEEVESAQDGSGHKIERFLHIEQPDWRSGFAQCELLLFPFKELWDRTTITYRALALCRIGGKEQQHGREEAVRDMRSIMREELPEADPGDAFYLYAYYQALKYSGAPEVDMNTAISLAFKRLQRRASRIDDNTTRRIFLSAQYWNSALQTAAREHKLI